MGVGDREAPSYVHVPSLPAHSPAEIQRLGGGGVTQVGVYLKGLEEAGGSSSVARDEAEGGVG